MSLEPTILADADDVGHAAAELVLDRYASAADSGRPFLLGCPGGRSAASTYQALARLVSARTIDLGRLVIVMMDEYVVPGADGQLERVDPALSYSCLGFAHREIVAPLAAAAQAAGTNPPADLWIPDPAAPQDYDSRIEAAGGVDLFLLASGASDGHIAFNQPGTPRSARTHVTELGEATRTDNMGTFPEFVRLDLVPTHGVTVGVGTIASQSHEVVMIVIGEHKRQAFDRLVTIQSYDPQWPATVLVDCAKPTFFADVAAAGIHAAPAA